MLWIRLQVHICCRTWWNTIDLTKIIEPVTDNHLVVEGAGGVFVPLNTTDCVIDLIQPDYDVSGVEHYIRKY
jgi:dethiobiotin synthetase